MDGLVIGRVYCEPEQQGQPGEGIEPPQIEVPWFYLDWSQPADHVTVLLTAHHDHKRAALDLMVEAIRDYGA